METDGSLGESLLLSTGACSPGLHEERGGASREPEWTWSLQGSPDLSAGPVLHTQLRSTSGVWEAACAPPGISDLQRALAPHRLGRISTNLFVAYIAVSRWKRWP